MHRTAAALSGVALLAWSLSVQAQNQCDAALIKATYNSVSTDKVDWRLATLVSEQTWNEITHNGSVNVDIFGVTGGASYGDFQKNTAAKKNTHDESLTIDQSRNIMWTGLDPTASVAYIECIKTVFGQRGLHLAVKQATQTQITFQVNWTPIGNDPNPVSPTWQPRRLGSVSFPRSISPGPTEITVQRPARQTTVTVNYPGSSADLVLEPLPPLPKEHEPLTINLTSGGFSHAHSGQHQVPGCGCGTNGIGIYSGASGSNTNVSVLTTKAGQPLEFRWDGGWIC